jgi:hypothetical protein
MSLIVEDGSARADSESYASVAQIDAYHSARGNAQWVALTSTEKEQAARRACDYLTQMYHTKWKGARARYDQALDWPRIDVRLDDIGLGMFNAFVPYNTVPQQVINATAEMALRAAAGELAPDLQRTVAEESIGPIKTVYAAGAPEYVRYRSIDLLLKPLLAAGGMGMRMVRA